MGFRAQEDVLGHIKAKAASKMSQEMVAAGVVRATDEIAGKKWLIKAQALGSNSCLQFGLNVLAYRRSVNSIEIIKNWTIRCREDVHVLVGTPGNLTANAEVSVEKQKVAAERRVSASADGLRREIPGGYIRHAGIRCRVPANRAIAEGQVKLLRLRAGCCRKDDAKSRE